MVRRALVTHTGVRLSVESFSKHLHNPRFADPGLARKQCNLPVSFLGCPPSVHQQTDFLIASDEGGQSRAMHGFESVIHGARGDNPPRMHRFGDTLQ